MKKFKETFPPEGCLNEHPQETLLSNTIEMIFEKNIWEILCSRLKYHPSIYLSQRSSFPNNSWSFGFQLDFFFLQRDFHVFFAFSEFLGRRISGTTWKTWYCISIHSSEFMSLSSTRCMMIMTMLMMMMMMMMMMRTMSMTMMRSELLSAPAIISL